ncbi:Opy2 domain-containing protein [Mycena chlorophos]|uniref:Opy2 domain-containing protein n=1 Tax=Mycena chlorophos TaxID=658473 RepID=A0A8H6T9B6_MYCCL|nr:Opy2 domain-containing protein [Mycena chlorophos]
MRLEALLPRQSQGSPCIQCGSTPSCNCAPGQQCFLVNRSCNQCAYASCVSSSSGSSSKGGVSKGALAGAIIGVLIFLALAICAFLWYRRRQSALKSTAFDVKPDIPASAETVLGRADPNEKPATPSVHEPSQVVRVFATANQTIDLDPQSQNSPLHTSSRQSTQSNPFSDSHSIQTAGTESTNVIPIALVAPEHHSTSDTIPTTSTGPIRPPRSPDLNLEHANVSLDSVRPSGHLAAPSQRSGVSGVSSRNSYMSNASFASDFLNEAPMIITPVKGNVRVVKAEVINAGSLSSPVTSEGPRASRPPITSPLASRSFGPDDAVAEEDESAVDPFQDRPASPASVSTFGHPSMSSSWVAEQPNLPWAHSGGSRPTSLSTQAGSVMDIGNVGSATRVNVGLLTPGSPGAFPRSPYRTTMGRLVTPNTANTDSLEEQQQRALDHAQARAQAAEPSRRISNSSVMTSASRADSILESFPFVPPSPISDRPMRSPPVSPLAKQSFSVVPPADKEPELPPPNRKMLGMSTASQFSTASSGLGSFPFQIDPGTMPDSIPPTPFSGRQRASLDTLAITADLSSYPLGFDRDSSVPVVPRRDNNQL